MVWNRVLLFNRFREVEMEHITLEEYKQLQQKGNSKYKNKKVIIDGIEFDSKKERKILSTIKINGKTRANKRH